jgi:RNA polymerase sigma factor (TIGR02999 family)
LKPPQDEPAEGPITRAFAEMQRDTPGASERLYLLIYGELRRVAGAFLRDQRAGHTLQPTALVHEAYLRLVGGAEPRWNDRVHFLSAAARAMRTVLVDMARARGAEKRGGGRLRVELVDDLDGSHGPDEDVVAVNDALEKLERIDPRWARIVELRFFAGLGRDETARVLGVSPATVHREWTHARAWLYREMTR